MSGHPPQQLSVAFGAVVGAAGFPLALLVLSASYQAALVLESLAFALLTVFAILMVRVHRRLSRAPPAGRGS